MNKQGSELIGTEKDGSSCVGKGAIHNEECCDLYHHLGIL